MTDQQSSQGDPQTQGGPETQGDPNMQDDPETQGDHNTQGDVKMLIVGALKRIWLPAMLVPPLLTAALAVGVCAGLLPWLQEATMETVALVVVALALAVGLVRLALTREPYFLWLTVLIAVLLCREIHFAGTSAGVYVGFACMLAVAWWKYPLLKNYFASRTVMTLLAMIFFSYFLAKTLDQNWWKMVPGEDTFERPVEETMEVVGHCLLLLLATISTKAKPNTQMDHSA